MKELELTYGYSKSAVSVYIYTVPLPDKMLELVDKNIVYIYNSNL
jgi:hypothetical protein